MTLDAVLTSFKYDLFQYLTKPFFVPTSLYMFISKLYFESVTTSYILCYISHLATEPLP